MKKIIGLTVGTLVVIGGLLHYNIIHLPFERTITARFIAGLEDDRVFVGASHNILVGKVVKKVGQTASENAPLSTQYDIQVITNIKGDLSGVTRMSQEGGYENGIKVTTEGQQLLTVGSTYILSARTDGAGMYMISSYPRGVIHVTSNTALNVPALQSLAKGDGNVLALQKAYAEEIPLEADVVNGKNFNSYSSMQK